MTQNNYTNSVTTSVPNVRQSVYWSVYGHVEYTDEGKRRIPQGDRVQSGHPGSQHPGCEVGYLFMYM